MGYYIDLNGISLGKFMRKLKTENLLPSQMLLKENIEARFDILKSQNLKTMDDIRQALKTKKDISRFASKTSLPEDYLTVLRREVNSYHPQPRKIKDFPEIPDPIKRKLESIGIKTTVELYNKLVSKKIRSGFAKEINATDKEILLLTKLTDLSRIRYVNQAFATLLTNTEYDTIEKIKNADYRELYNRLILANEDKKYFRGKFGLNDIKFLIKESGDIPVETEY